MYTKNQTKRTLMHQTIHPMYSHEPFKQFLELGVISLIIPEHFYFKISWRLTSCNLLKITCDLKDLCINNNNCLSCFPSMSEWQHSCTIYSTCIKRSNPLYLQSYALSLLILKYHIMNIYIHVVSPKEIDILKNYRIYLNILCL